MKNIPLLFIFLIFLSSCVFSEKKTNLEADFPFKGIKIEKVGYNNSRSQDYTILHDSLVAIEVNKILKNINSKQLIKGKRQHAAKNIYSIKLIQEGNNLLLFINETNEGNVTIDFFEENQEINYSYFLGCLYDSEELYEVLNKNLIKLGKI